MLRDPFGQFSRNELFARTATETRPLRLKTRIYLQIQDNYMLFQIETVDITKTLHSLHTLSTFEPTLDSDIEINTNKKQTIA